MSDNIDQERAADGTADVIATIAIMGVVIFTACYWLAGMPS